MTFFRGFDVQGDLSLTPDGRDFAVGEGARQTVQAIEARAQIFKGSWRYDLGEGVPYREDILIGSPDEAVARRHFYDLIAGTPGIASVKSVTLRLDSATQRVLVDFVAVDGAGRPVSGTLGAVAGA